MPEIAVCNSTITVDSKNRLSCDSWSVEPHSATFAQALQNHADALNANTLAMDKFFEFDPALATQVSGFMLVMFLTGHWLGKVAHLMRKT